MRRPRFPTIRSTRTSTTVSGRTTTNTTETTYAAGSVQVGKLGRLPWLPFEGLIALLMVVTGTRNLFDPVRASVPGAPQSVSTFISIVYVLGGALMFLGLIRSWVRVEMFGLMCLVVGIATSTLLILSNHGADVLVDLIVFAGSALAAAVRLNQLAHRRFVVQVKVEPSEP